MLDSEDGKIGEDAHALCCPKHGNQDVHDDQEEEWGQGVPLPKPTAVEESFPGASIDEHLVDDELRSNRTHLIQRGPKPRCLRTLRRKAQETLSNALATSSFRRRVGTFHWWSVLVACCTRTKLSSMQRPLMNALWLA
jgi:hypothetical protein